MIRTLFLDLRGSIIDLIKLFKIIVTNYIRPKTTRNYEKVNNIMKARNNRNIRI